jgi:uncharacterized protein YbjT (DUF2867 family)
MARVLVTGATGFVGRALVPALTAAGHQIRATTRGAANQRQAAGVEWVVADIGNRDDCGRALAGIDFAYFLVHAMGGGQRDYAAAERLAARQFAEAAAAGGVKRIVYLGGVSPAGTPSAHLESRLAVGEVLRAGTVPALELRASMIVGNGSASWQIVRDLAMRLPAMLLPAWTESKTCPVALDDAIIALVRALDVPLASSAVYDIPGPDTLSAREILLAIAALRGRHVPSLRVPFLSVSLSSWWLKLVTRAEFSLARELVLGLTYDLLPQDDRYWKEIGYTPNQHFVDAARDALSRETRQPTALGIAGRFEEAVVQLVSPKLPAAKARPPSRRAS